MSNINIISKVQEPYIHKQNTLVDFNVGDTVKVGIVVSDVKGTERVQYIQGIVIKFSGSGTDKTFTIRKIGANGTGVEMIIPIYSKFLVSIDVVNKGKVRRAKLYYLRKRIGKSATTL